MILTGGMGVGKTRLAVEVAARPPEGWTVRRLRAGREAAAGAVVLQLGAPHLLVVETVAGAAAVAGFLADLHAVAAGVSLRIMLITRTDAWIDRLRSQLPEHAHTLLDTALSLPLQHPGGREDDARWFAEAVDDFAVAQGKEAPGLTPARVLVPIESFGDLHARALARTLALSPLSERVAKSPRSLDLPLDETINLLVDHERRQWSLPPVPMDDVLRNRCVAVLTLLGVADGGRAEADAAGLLQAVPDLAEVGGESARRQIARWIHDLYPGVNQDWIAVPSPRWLAHHLVLHPLLQDEVWAAVQRRITPSRLPRILDLTASAAATGDRAGDLLSDVVHFTSSEEVGLEAILASADSRRVDLLLAHLIRGRYLPEDAYTELQTLLDQRYPHAILELARRDVDRLRTTDDIKALAHATITLGSTLLVVGRPAEAMSVDQEAINLLHDLNDEESRVALAAATGNLAIALLEDGRHDDAVTVGQEHVRLRSQLVQGDDDKDGRYRFLVAMKNLASILGVSRRYEEHLVVVNEVLKLWRQEVLLDSSHKPELANALADSGSALFDLRRSSEALVVIEESLILWQELTTGHAENRPGLARTLHVYGNVLSEVGRHEEAAAAAEEAVMLWRSLTDEDPVNFSSLARATVDLGVVLDNGGHPRKAVSKYLESVSLWRKLAAEQPAFRVELASVIHSISAALVHAGLLDEARSLSSEALEMWRQLAAEDEAHREHLARTLANRGTVLDQTRNYGEALEVGTQMVELWRTLSTEDTRHLSGLAGALHSLAVALLRLDRPEDALRTANESVELWRQIPTDNALNRSAPAVAEGLQRELLRRLYRDDEIIFGR